MGTATAHRGSTPAGGQLVPGVAEVITADSTRRPAARFLTVTEKVMVAAALAARFPVQVRFGLSNDTAPAARFPVQVRFGLSNDTAVAVAVASPLYAALSRTRPSASVNVTPVNRVVLVLETVIVKSTVPPGAADDVPVLAAMTSGSAPIASVTASVVISPSASLTCTVNAELPSAVGVPDRTPVEAFSVIPAGRRPALTDHVNGPVPPDTASVSR